MIDLEKIRRMKKNHLRANFYSQKTAVFHFSLFFDRIFAAANAAATTRLSDGNEQVFRNFAPEKRLVFFVFSLFLILAAANAAATTRLSIGNEQVFRNFAPEHDMHF